MKTILFTLICTTFFVQTYAQDVSFIDNIDEEKVISDIREKFKSINENAETTYIKKEHEIEASSSEGSEVYSYYDKNDLRKIHVSFYGEIGKSIIEYYFWNESVFFIFRQDYAYNSSIYNFEDMPELGIEAHDPEKTIIEENRFYFNQNKLIRWLDPEKKQIDPLIPEFRQKEFELVGETESIQSQIKNQ